MLTVALLVALVLVSGCADVSFGSQKIGDFGSTKEEQKAVEFFKAKYGDPLTNSGPPRFLEPMVTTGLVNNTPVDKVTKFSKDTGSIFFWVFYDNFKKGDKLTLTWTYKGVTVITLDREAGGDFGRAFGEFLKPDKGWATGAHTITISGGGTSATATFEIIDGATVTEPLPYKQEDLSSVSDRSPKNLGNAAPEDRSPVTKQSSSNDPAVGVLPDKRGSVERADHTMVSLCGPHQNIKNGECICDDPSMKACGKDCINQLVDNNNCGDCGINCGSDQKCNGGRCECSIGGKTICGGKCVDLASDVDNCGICNNACPHKRKALDEYGREGVGEWYDVDAATCDSGRCVCGKYLTLCGDTCTTLKVDPDNCGSCGHQCVGDTPMCDVNGYCRHCETCGGKYCVILYYDSNNCGSCGNACPSGRQCDMSECK